MKVANIKLMDDVAALVAQGQSVNIRVKGGSMRPFIYDGDSVELQSIGQLRVGDIVLAFCDGGYYVIHRVECIEDDRILLRGDGNIGITEYADRSRVGARVVTIYHSLRGGSTDPYKKPQLLLAKLWRMLYPFRGLLLRVLGRLRRMRQPRM